MSLSIVGAGRVGRALGRLLHKRGWRIGAVVTRSAATARAAAKAIGAGKPCSRLTPEIFSADVILLTTPDAAIAPTAANIASLASSVAAGLPRHIGRVMPPLQGKIVLHSSGALDHRLLSPLARRGAAVASLHPFQTFGERAVPNLSGVIFTVEGDPRALRLARRIALSLGGTPIQIPVAAKPAYHAAGGFVAAHTLALVEAAVQMLVALGFPRRLATRGLLRMARQALDNLEKLGPRASWTGPVSRGDFGTIARHMTALRRFPREYRAAHEVLLLLSARVLAEDRGGTLRRLKRMLEE
jgi:predicted short-subunit dehydrogenase-like oxidoreductase (DUF2520 family)